MMMKVNKEYSNDEVREMLEEFRAEKWNPKYSMLADGIGINYQYLINWKNGDKEMGRDALNRIVTFIENNS